MKYIADNCRNTLSAIYYFIGKMTKELNAKIKKPFKKGRNKL